MKYKAYNILAIFLLFCSFQTKAQEAVYVGTILNTSDSIALEGVHIINKSTNIGVVSKANGSFSIMASPNDTLIISSVGFFIYNHVISKSYFNVYLQRRIYDLESFTVLPYKDYEEFKHAFSQLRIQETPNPINKSIYVPKEELLAAYNEANTGIIISGGISAILGAFNKYVQDKKSYLKLLEQDKKQAAVDEKLNPIILMRITPINDFETAEHFLSYCDFSNQFIIYASEFDLHKEIHTCYDEFYQYVINN
ncbi:MAG: hypothetical protein RQ875_06675 [Vicingaceae bacterium]|nr:hypothetical protein [Vicingaceae bacterium]